MIARRLARTLALLTTLLPLQSCGQEQDRDGPAPPPTDTAPPSADTATRTPGASSTLAALDLTLLRPLDSSIDPRLRGRLTALPPLGGSKPDLHADEQAAIAELESMWERVARDRPDDVGAWLDVAKRFLWLDYASRAEWAAEAVLEVDAQHARALALLAAASHEQGRRSTAVQLASRALSSARSEASAAAPYLALVIQARAMATGDLAAATFGIQTLHQAMELAPDRPEAPHALGTLAYEENGYVFAIPYLERAARHEADPEGGKHKTLAMCKTFAELLGGRRAHGRPDDFPGLEVPLERAPVLPAIRASLDDGRGAARTGRLVIDSGSSMTVLGPEAAPFLRRVPGRVANVSVATPMGVHQLEPCVLPVLEIGPLRLTDVPVLLDEARTSAIGPEVLGSIGVSLLREFHVVLDLPRSRFQLLPAFGTLQLPEPSVPEGASLLPGELRFELVGNLLLVPAHFDGGPERLFAFDTGASSLFVAPQVLATDLGIDPDDPTTSSCCC